MDKYAQSEAIARELETSLQIDVRNHKYVNLLPSVTDCGKLATIQ